MKMNMGYVINPTTNVKKDIIVKTAIPNSVKDTAIGYGLILIGAVYLTSTAFRNGVKKMEDAELKTLSETKLI